VLDLNSDTQGLRLAAENTQQSFANIQSFSFSYKQIMGKKKNLDIRLIKECHSKTFISGCESGLEN
jgi:hypothetical protein